MNKTKRKFIMHIKYSNFELQLGSHIVIQNLREETAFTFFINLIRTIKENVKSI